jgi:betaine-aldehyde dehydrogenase
MTNTITETPEPATKASRRHHFVNGRWHAASEETLSRLSPVDGRLLAEYAVGTQRDVELAVAAARGAFDAGPWPRMSGMERGAALSRLADLLESRRGELARIDAEEVGKPLRTAEGDIDGAVGNTRFAAGLAAAVHGDVHTNLGDDFTGLIIREPVGVVAVIVPWNFPALILMQKLAFALAAGCATVVKPSEFTSGSALRIAELATHAGIPDGVLNVVTGDGQTGQALVESAEVDLASFTGSTATGQKVLAASQGNLKRVSLELGGKAAQIVFADADLEDAVEGVLFGAVFNQGECCVAGARLLVEEQIAADFVGRLVSRARQLRVGGPDSEGADLGALIHPEHLRSALAAVTRAREQGARLLLGGERLGGVEHRDGCFMAPTVLDQVEPGNSAFDDEIFAPVLSVTRFKGADQAIELANAVAYGLGNTVWSKDIDKVLTVSRALRSGTVWVNCSIDGAPQLPFGGVKASGYGREMGRAGLEEFTELKTVQVRTGKRAGTFNLSETDAA